MGKKHRRLKKRKVSFGESTLVNHKKHPSVIRKQKNLCLCQKQKNSEIWKERWLNNTGKRKEPASPMRQQQKKAGDIDWMGTAGGVVAGSVIGGIFRRAYRGGKNIGGNAYRGGKNVYNKGHKYGRKVMDRQKKRRSRNRFEEKKHSIQWKDYFYKERCTTTFPWKWKKNYE